MSCWDLLCGPALVETPARRGKHQQRQSRGLGDRGAHTGTRTAAGRLAEVGAPGVVPGRSAVALAPDNVIRRVNDAIQVEVASECGRNHIQKHSRAARI
jgi:hypothetical protein